MPDLRVDFRALEGLSQDLREQLVFLHELVGTAYTNHANAVSVNTAMWQA